MLRTILLVTGILIILAIAFDGWRRKQKRLKQASQARRVPSSTNTNDEQRQQVFEDLAEPEPDFETTSTPSTTEIIAPVVAEESVVTDEDSATDDTKILELKDKFTVDPSSKGPTPVDIKPLEKDDDSANQELPSTPSIKSENIQSANQAMPPKVEQAKPELKQPEVITLTIMSIGKRPFAGYDVIKALQDCHLHHGEFDIYHRHKYRNGKGPLLFSVASVVKPGTINPRRVGELSTPGLALFMSLNNPKHDRSVFKQVLATAHEIAKTLGGVVCDQHRVPLREGTLQAYADKINL